MAMVDIFGSDAFGLVSLTESMNALPYVPKRLGAMGLFKPKGVTTKTVVIEERDGILALIPSVEWGGPATQARKGKRRARSFVVPHIPLEDQILASDVQDVRQFGSESATAGIATVVNDRLEELKQSHEATHEWLRCGCIQGSIVDGDASTELFDIFTLFGVTETEVDFVLGTDTTDVGSKCLSVKRSIEAAIGDMPFDHVHAMCGETWFDAFVAHPEVKYAYQYFQEGKMLRDDPRAGFEYKGVIFEEYRGNVGSNAFIPAVQARFFPVGAPGLFVEYYAPADFVETVNTIGLPFYAKQEPMPFDRGITLHTQSNPLPLCTRPLVLVKGTTS